MSQGADWFRGEEGQGLLEYALILVLVSIVSIAMLTTLGVNILGVLFTLVNNIFVPAA
ncbi:MAG: Flp family type IVb pilin [Nitrospinota bacterium]